MLRKPDTPKRILTQRERSRRWRMRRRNGVRVYRLALRDMCVEGLITPMIAHGRLTEEQAFDHGNVERELARMLDEQGARWSR